MKVPKDSGSTWWFWPIAFVLAATVSTGVWYMRSRAGGSIDPEVLWRQAELDFQEARYRDAEKAVATLARIRTPTPLDRMLRAQIAAYHKEEDKAIAELTAIPDNTSITPQARLLEGQIELRRNRLAFAEEKLRAACVADPNSVMPHRELIYIYGVQLRRKELNAEFLALSKVSPLNYDNVFHWCLTRNSDWEREEHNKMLQGYLAADPKDRNSRLALAENLRQLGRRSEADKVIEPLPNSDPKALEIRVWLALDRNDETLGESLLAQAPENVPELDRLKGRLALARGDAKSALKSYQAAYAAEPDNRDSVFGLGQALTLRGDAKAAAPWIERARDHDALGTLVQRAATPEGRKDPQLLKSLGAACEKVHRFPEARAWYNLAIQADALDLDAQKALYRIKEQEGKT